MRKITGGSQWKNSSGKKHYEMYRRRYIEAAQLRQVRNLAFLLAYRKTQKCLDCGNSDHRVLDFDHRDPAIKRGNVYTLARSGVSIQTLKIEIEKCDVRCSNCHRIRHYEENGYGASSFTRSICS